MNIENSLTLISKTPILSEEGLLQLRKLGDSLQHGFEKGQIRRPKYLMTVAVLNNMKFPTPDAKYWQCILERDIQFQNLVMLSYDVQEELADIEIINAEIDQFNHSHKTKMILAKVKKLKIQIERKQANLTFMEKDAKERLREIVSWSELIEQIEPEMKFSRDNPEKHMPESFLIKCAYQKRIISEIGASDMNGAMNIFSLGETASEYWKENGSDPYLTLKPSEN